MRVYIAHNMDRSEELKAKLEAVEGKLADAQKTTDEGARLLWKAEEETEVAKAEARQLAEERELMEAGKKKAEWLRQELQELRAGFSV